MISASLSIGFEQETSTFARSWSRSVQFNLAVSPKSVATLQSRDPWLLWSYGCGGCGKFASGHWPSTLASCTIVVLAWLYKGSWKLFINKRIDWWKIEFNEERNAFYLEQRCRNYRIFVEFIANLFLSHNYDSLINNMSASSKFWSLHQSSPFRPLVSDSTGFCEAVV